MKRYAFLVIGNVRNFEEARKYDGSRLSVGCFATSSSKVISRPPIREWYTVPRFFYVKIVLFGAGRIKKVAPD